MRLFSICNIKRLVGCAIFLVFFTINAMAVTDNARVRYWMQVKVNNMDCVFYLNDLYLFGTMKYSNTQTSLTMGHPIEKYMMEGENILKARAIEGTIDPEFGEAYCEIAISAIVLNDNAGTSGAKDITMIRVTYDKEGQFSAQESKAFPEPTVTAPAVLKKLTTKTFHDSKLNDVEVTRPLQVNHPQPFSWVHATPFTDTAANRALLWDKYEEYRTAFANKDLQAIKALVEPGLSDIVRFSARESDEYFETVAEQLNFQKKYDDPDLSLITLNKADYELQIYAKGKLFRFVRKGSDYVSPIIWQSKKDKDYRTYYSPIFTFINGKIVHATF